MNLIKLNYTVIATVSFLLLTNQSCKKTEYIETVKQITPDYGQGYGKCRVVFVRDTVYSNGLISTVFPQKYMYDDKYRLNYMSIPNTVGIQFDYLTDRKIWRKFGGIPDIDTILLDEKGRVYKTTFQYGNKYSTEYHYKPNGEIMMSVNNNIYPPTLYDTAHFYYENGDLTEVDDNGAITKYEYDVNEPFQAIGDGRNIEDFLKYGRILTRTRHMVKRITHYDGRIADFEYRFDTEHRLVSIQFTTKIGTYNQKYVRWFEYSCD